MQEWHGKATGGEKEAERGRKDNFCEEIVLKKIKYIARKVGTLGKYKIIV